jgi:curved DNA-binding protein CbpA
MSSTPIDFDPYAVLGVGEDATSQEIKSAHRKLVLKCHPDKVKDETQKAKAQKTFNKVQESYELLFDENRRVEYDQAVKLAELQKEAKKRGWSSSSFSYGHSNYGEQTPFADDQRSSSRKYDDRKYPRSKGMDEENRSESGPGTKAARSQTKERRQPSGKYERAAPYEPDDELKRQSSAKDGRSYSVPDDDSPYFSETDSSYHRSIEARNERERQLPAYKTSFKMPTYLESDDESIFSDSSHIKKSPKERRRKSAKHVPKWTPFCGMTGSAHGTNVIECPNCGAITPSRRHKRYSAERPSPSGFRPPNPDVEYSYREIRPGHITGRTRRHR